MSGHTWKRKLSMCADLGVPNSELFILNQYPVTLGVTKQCHHISAVSKRGWHDTQSLGFLLLTHG